MLTQASWPGPPSSAPELAPTLAHLFIVDSTAVTPPKTPAMRAPLPPPKEDANPFGFHPGDVDGDSRFRLDECGCRFADGGSSDSDGNLKWCFEIETEMLPLKPGAKIQT